MATGPRLTRRSIARIAHSCGFGDISGFNRAFKADTNVTPTEFRILRALIDNAGRPFTRAQLLDAVWGQAAEIDERTVAVHVGRLRTALSRGRERDPIRTVRGAGYAFDETFGKV